MRNKHLFFPFTIFAGLCFFLFSSRVMSAKADDLIIQNDGKVILIITNGVLGVTTTEEPKKTHPPKETKPSEKHEDENKPPSPAKIVPIVPAHTESTVHIDPPINNDKKIQVTITTPSAPSSPPPSGRTTNISTPTMVMTKSVDQVVAQGTNGKAVYRIISNEASHLTIRQGTTEVSTRLPLQIDTLTHDLSVSLGSNDSAQIAVLPNEALKGVENKGFLNNTNRDQTKITLTNGLQGVSYTIQNEKKGKLFGVLDIKVPVIVQLSAQNGKVLTTPQSLFLSLFSRFIQ